MREKRDQSFRESKVYDANCKQNTYQIESGTTKRHKSVCRYKFICRFFVCLFLSMAHENAPLIKSIVKKGVISFSVWRMPATITFKIQENE